jgi:hypothetical protein
VATASLTSVIRDVLVAGEINVVVVGRVGDLQAFDDQACCSQDSLPSST